MEKIILLIVLFTMFGSCGIAYSQTESIDSTLLCNECDSLYSRICPSGMGNYGFLENPPQFLGGEKELMKFIAENLKYPDECMEIQGRVIVRFIIDETGKIICPKIQRSLHPLMDEEALRIVGLMPDFIPASNNGIAIKMCYTLPVLFKLNTTNTDSNGKLSFFKRIFRNLF